MNRNLPDGADTQCAYDRSGVLCGAFQEHLNQPLPRQFTLFTVTGLQFLL